MHACARGSLIHKQGVAVVFGVLPAVELHVPAVHQAAQAVDLLSEGRRPGPEVPEVPVHEPVEEDVVPPVDGPGRAEVEGVPVAVPRHGGEVPEVRDDEPAALQNWDGPLVSLAEPHPSRVALDDPVVADHLLGTAQGRPVRPAPEHGVQVRGVPTVVVLGPCPLVPDGGRPEEHLLAGQEGVDQPEDVRLLVDPRKHDDDDVEGTEPVHMLGEPELLRVVLHEGVRALLLDVELAVASQDRAVLGEPLHLLGLVVVLAHPVVPRIPVPHRRDLLRPQEHPERDHHVLAHGVPDEEHAGVARLLGNLRHLVAEQLVVELEPLLRAGRLELPLGVLGSASQALLLRRPGPARRAVTRDAAGIGVRTAHPRDVARLRAVAPRVEAIRVSRPIRPRRRTTAPQRGAGAERGEGQRQREGDAGACHHGAARQREEKCKVQWSLG
mmetsp:Transcript_78493/g.243445  ORF Transcript_78493/g.243445 Transcript_78493/m.243445 type:complete len:440 (-) Transcript_78493:3-1322(-)